jgi:hypothetical protein
MLWNFLFENYIETRTISYQVSRNTRLNQLFVYLYKKIVDVCEFGLVGTANLYWSTVNLVNFRFPQPVLSSGVCVNMTNQNLV